jgi:Uncharacterised nucleotidyltransferase
MLVKQPLLFSPCAMPTHNTSLIALCGCLRGEPPQHIDWPSLIGLANDTLTTPALMSLVERCPEKIPHEVCQYIREISVRNQQRNKLLSSQLHDAVKALNKIGITPVLMKGAATLAASESTQQVSRLISDLDIVVSTEESEAALEALFAIGYQAFVSSPEGATRWCVDLGRDADVGMIDLHRSLPGHRYFYRSIGNIRQHCSMGPSRVGTVYIPLSTYQAFILIVHDEFQDDDYWTGHIDLRHLLDLVGLARSAEGIDWKLLASLSSSKLYRNALETQMIALHSLFGVEVPRQLLGRFTPRLQFRRRLLQARFPSLRRPLLATALLDYRTYRTEVGAEERTRKTSKPQLWSLPKRDSVRFLLDRSAEKRVGKI